MTDIITPTRRRFLIGVTASIIAAPAIVRAEIIMPVRNIIRPEKKEIIRQYSGSGFVIIQADPRFIDTIFDDTKRVDVIRDQITGEPVFVQVPR